MTQLCGIFAAMCTPFEDDGETIDRGRYRAHIDDMIEAGLHGLVLCSGTGEYAYLRDDERTLLIREGARHVDDRVPTIAQTTADCIARARVPEDCGVTAVMVMPPFLDPPGERGVLYHYEAIARAIRAGTVSVNCYGEGDVTTPFGGYKLSGFGGRDKSLAAHDQYCETKAIWMDLSS